MMSTGPNPLNAAGDIAFGGAGTSLVVRDMKD